MQFESVCKFNYNRSSDLICLNFIYETQNMLDTPMRAARHGIYLVTEGSGTLTCERKELEICAGSIFFVQEGERYFITSKDAIKYYYINFYGRRADEYLQRIGVEDGKRHFTADRAMIDFWHDSHASAEAGNIDIMCEAVLLYTIARLKPEKKEQNDVVAKMVTMVHESFSDPELSISAIADKLGYDPKYLSTVFKKRKGIGFTQYLREMRLKHAVFLMEQGLVSVKNIALLSGFSDALYFSRLFTQAEGISPKAYMERVGSTDVMDGDEIVQDLFSRRPTSPESGHSEPKNLQ